MKPQRVALHLRRAMFAGYAVLLVVLGYAFWRYEVVTLPGTGCSPLAAYEPGADLLVDCRPGELALGDAVFFRLAGDLHLGRLAEPPASAPAETWAAYEGGGLWIVGDRAECPDADSLRHGVLDPACVEGRILFAWPW